MLVTEKAPVKTSGNGHSKDPIDLGPPRPPYEPPSGGPSGQPQRSGWTWIRVASWAASIIILTVYIAWPRPQLPAEPVENVDGRRSFGQVNAPITILAYSDFACPSCRDFYESGTLQEILKAYPTQVRFIWRDFPVVTALSPKAAEAGLCASDQDRFWQYHNLLYANFYQLEIEHLKDAAVDLGLDSQEFDQCLESGAHWPEVQRDLRAGLRTDRTLPPVFVINGEVSLVGPAKFSDFQKKIDELLSLRGN